MSFFSSTRNCGVGCCCSTSGGAIPGMVFDGFPDMLRLLAKRLQVIAVEFDRNLCGHSGEHMADQVSDGLFDFGFDSRYMFHCLMQDCSINSLRLSPLSGFSVMTYSLMLTPMTCSSCSARPVRHVNHNSGPFGLACDFTSLPRLRSAIRLISRLTSSEVPGGANRLTCAAPSSTVAGNRVPCSKRSPR